MTSIELGPHCYASDRTTDALDVHCIAGWMISKAFSDWRDAELLTVAATKVRHDGYRLERLEDVRMKLTEIFAFAVTWPKLDMDAIKEGRIETFTQKNVDDVNAQLRRKTDCRQILDGALKGGGKYHLEPYYREMYDEALDLLKAWWIEERCLQQAIYTDRDNMDSLHNQKFPGEGIS